MLIIDRQEYARSLNENTVVIRNQLPLPVPAAAAAMKFLPLVASRDTESALSITVNAGMFSRMFTSDSARAFRAKIYIYIYIYVATRGLDYRITYSTPRHRHHRRSVPKIRRSALRRSPIVPFVGK